MTATIEDLSLNPEVLADWGINHRRLRVYRPREIGESVRLASPPVDEISEPLVEQPEVIEQLSTEAVEVHSGDNESFLALWEAVAVDDDTPDAIEVDRLPFARRSLRVARMYKHFTDSEKGRQQGTAA